jgi:hypothetical protein
MRYFISVLVALCISASTLFAADPNGQQIGYAALCRLARD